MPNGASSLFWNLDADGGRRAASPYACIIITIFFQFSKTCPAGDIRRLEGRSAFDTFMIHYIRIGAMTKVLLALYMQQSLVYFSALKVSTTRASERGAWRDL